MTADEVAKDIVYAAIKVHRALGPGLLESAYQACLAHELRRRKHLVECEVALSLLFEGVLIEVGYRIDMRIDQLILPRIDILETQLQVTSIGSPRPSAGEGLGGEGDTSLLEQLPKLGSG
jgi:GxxExxY protein